MNEKEYKEVEELFESEDEIDHQIAYLRCKKDIVSGYIGLNPKSEMGRLIKAQAKAMCDAYDEMIECLEFLKEEMSEKNV